METSITQHTGTAGQGSSPQKPTSGKVPRRLRLPVDRGERPVTRGLLHSRASWAFSGSGIALIVVAAVNFGVGFRMWMTVLYVLCLVGAMSVSALYHRGKWRTNEAVQWWRRADHSMIAIFIAGTYGPICATALPGATVAWLLGATWIGTACAVVLNMVWIEHPRWLDAVVYLALGWLVVWYIPELWRGAGAAVVILVAVGGVIYSLGAAVYALQWPNPSKRWFGFHEVFHAATIAAAIVHHVAIWLLIAQVV